MAMQDSMEGKNRRNAKGDTVRTNHLSKQLSDSTDLSAANSGNCDEREDKRRHRFPNADFATPTACLPRLKNINSILKYFIAGFLF
jgi:hypothetical protein